MSHHTFRTTIGEDVTVVVYFDYQPHEVRTAAYPGCFAEVCVESVFVDGLYEISDILRHETLEALKVECFEFLERQT